MEAVGQINIDNDGSAVIQKTLDYTQAPKTLDLSALFEKYQLEETIQRINSGGFSNIALQFPDGLLVDSASICLEIRKKTKKNVFILGDTTFGSCCVDEVAASHIKADLIVHYGNTCFSHSSRIPVFYVFTNNPIDIDDAASQIASGLKPQAPQRVLILLDLFYRHAEDLLVQKLSETFGSQILTLPKKDTDLFFDPKTSAKTNIDFSLLIDEALSHPPPLIDDDLSNCSENTAIVFVGHEGSKLTNLIMSRKEPVTSVSFPSILKLQSFSHLFRLNRFIFTFQIFSYDPKTLVFRQESISVNRYLGRRYMKVIENLKQVLRQHRIKFYTILAGKINPAKMANFLEIEVFVTVACPENSLIDSKDFSQPVITPLEMLLALQHPAQSSPPPFFFLLLDIYVITHILIYLFFKYFIIFFKASDSDFDSNLKLSIRDQNNKVALKLDSLSFNHLQNRSYQGLDIDSQDKAPSQITDGRSGIARGYNTENNL
ncbi:Diphthamide biosynthesis protein 2 [Smittium mucronatum]|uniref:2-(3-amino-3-carboxypropyl)histidine synthase subunit 2 n=1 Tax=Smittium mucronatum TaxID=133383 RepID=A0A1R0GT78_9FUNG|nr:Diphthamide biosynthesis protein 2 [Smittium mucronatum]